jgi:hypothetical protein
MVVILLQRKESAGALVPMWLECQGLTNISAVSVQQHAA